MPADVRFLENLEGLDLSLQNVTTEALKTLAAGPMVVDDEAPVRPTAKVRQIRRSFGSFTGPATP